MAQGKLFDDIKWATRQRLQFIETMAYYCGVVSRSDVAKAFSISDAAATKDLKLYNELAPDNLIYRQNLFGFTPNKPFQEVFADLRPHKVLPMIADRLTGTSKPYGEENIYGLNSERLPLPLRFPDKHIVANITQAIRFKRKVRAHYLSLSDRDQTESRIIEPHTLVDTGLRWHVRAYNNESYDFRDFVLSRFSHAEILSDEADSDPGYDEEWGHWMEIRLRPHPSLDEKKRRALLLDYAATDEVIVIQTRQAMLGYLIQRLSVDTTKDASLNPAAHQLIIENRDEIELYASWVFH